MSTSSALKVCITKILNVRKTIKNQLFNYKCSLSENEFEIYSFESQLTAIDLFYNTFIDNLYYDLSRFKCCKEDHDILDEIYDYVFTNNTLYNMFISSDALILLTKLDTINQEAQNIIKKYASILLGTNYLDDKSTSKEFQQVLLCKLLIDKYFTWLLHFFTNETNVTNQLNEFNILIKKYNVEITYTKTFHQICNISFTNIFRKLSCQSLDDLSTIINYLSHLT